MLEVKFYDTAEDVQLKFAVIVSKYHGQWVFCKHKARDTYEVPGGHREPGESIVAAAKRELWEETGAVDYALEPVCVYSVVKDGEETFGMLFFADIGSFGDLPALEIEEVRLFAELPTKWTYPLIQPKLIEKVRQVIE